METIRAFAAEDATVIFGAVYDDTMADELRVTVVATGLGRIKQRPQLVQSHTPLTQPVPVLRTGTDNAPISMPTAPTPPGVNYEQLDTPAVWRNSRESAAARVSALEESGMDRLEIPAFLRKQAD